MEQTTTTIVFTSVRHFDTSLDMIVLTWYAGLMLVVLVCIYI